MSKFTLGQYAVAGRMRAAGTPWKIIERQIGEGMKDAYHSHSRHDRQKSSMARNRKVRVYSHRFEGNVQVSDRRARVMCNAWFGLDLCAGMRRTKTETVITNRTVRFLRRHGLLYENAVTDAGLLFLSQIQRKGDPHMLEVQSAPDQTMSSDHARPV